MAKELETQIEGHSVKVVKFPATKGMDRSEEGRVGKE